MPPGPVLKTQKRDPFHVRNFFYWGGSALCIKSTPSALMAAAACWRPSSPCSDHGGEHAAKMEARLSKDTQLGLVFPPRTGGIESSPAISTPVLIKAAMVDSAGRPAQFQNPLEANAKLSQLVHLSY
jgi:hypothetical protein